MDMTVVIPTYNGADRISAVLERLSSQWVPDGLDWEVIVVDNNSQDTTAEVVKKHQQQWSQHLVSLRYVFESTQGLAFARQCGVDNALGQIIGFLDDDNWPNQDWVFQAVQFGKLNPKVGAYGGKTEAIFESPPEMSINKISRFLALQNYGNKPYKFQPGRQILPAGAGLVVRRKAWLECMPKKLVRTGQGGDDYEISLRLSKEGWEIFYAPAMIIQHYIPASRLESSYLRQLSYGYGLCTCDLMMISAPLWKRPFLLSRFFLGTLKRLANHSLKHGWNHKDIGLQCQLNFHLGNLKSPFIYITRHIKQEY